MLAVSCSTEQAINLWHELSLALNGKHPYGSGNTADIYLYTVMPHSPSFSKRMGLGKPGDGGYAPAVRLVDDALRTIQNICGLFEDKNDCLVALRTAPDTWVPHCYLTYPEYRMYTSVVLRVSGTNYLE